MLTFTPFEVGSPHNRRGSDVHLSIATTKNRATDLGFLLHKHPDRVFESSQDRSSKVRATGFYAEAGEDRCEFCLHVEVDPVERVRGLAWSDGIAQYVEPQPFLAGSYMSHAISLALRSAMNGVATSKDAAEDARLKALVEETWPLEIVVSPVRTSRGLILRLFEPLGWNVEIDSVPLDVPGGVRETNLHTIRLAGSCAVRDALTHLYVLLPALDPQRHYFYGESEVEKLLEKSSRWLDGHPSKELIVSRYLSKSRELRETAFLRIDEGAGVERDVPEAQERQSAHDGRHQRIVQVLQAAGARRIADLGCGEGRLLSRLAELPGQLEFVGVEPSSRDLDKAKKNLSRNPSRQMDDRIKLLHGSVLYADDRLKDFDAAVLSEVVEHIEPDRLVHMERCVFGEMSPRMVVVTTPNGSYNAVFGLPAGSFRHPDHRFEWTREEAAAWAQKVSTEHGYDYDFSGIGDFVEEYGHLSHFIVFRKV
jgi:3' terminal RNA ribose 2'-O-methyltransferase Hen1